MDVIAAKQEGTEEVARRPASGKTASGLLEVGQRCQETCGADWRWRWLDGAKGHRKVGIFRRGNRLHEGRRQGHAKGTIEAGSSARRQIAEKLAAIKVYAVTRPHRQFSKR